MKKQKFIDKEQRSEYHLDMNELYAHGLELIQGFSGDKWTDYNEHDPGVTILETVIFGLTDVCFRLGFGVSDLLATDEDMVDAKERSLYYPATILTHHPVTMDDFRKIIFDRIDEASNVWIEPSDHDIQGLYSIKLFAKPSIHFKFKDKNYAEKVRNEVHGKVVALWPSIRNIGEDINAEDIQVLENQRVYIRAHLILQSNDSLESVFAHIVNRLDGYFNPQLERKSLDELKAKGLSDEQIFEGPFLSGGFIANESLKKPIPKRITKAEIVSIIMSIPGIDQIEDFMMFTGKDERHLIRQEKEIVIDDGHIPRFRFERETKDGSGPQQRLLKHNETSFSTIKMRRRNQNKYLDIDLDLMLKKLRQIQAIQNRNFNLNLSNLSKGNYQGTARQLDAYSTIQNDFPYIYGINQFGISKFDTKERKSQALQLKSYLVLFEQLLVNFTSQIQSLKTLFSIQELENTYFSKPLTSSQIESVEKLYNLEDSEEDNLETALEKMLHRVSEIHPHLDRKSRVLDYMLALYGERFSQSTLKRIQNNPEDLEGAKVVASNKATMLTHLQHFNRNKNRAPNYHAEKLTDQSGFLVKIAILLGLNLDNLNPDLPLEDVFKEGGYDLNLVSAQDLQRDPYLTWEKSQLIQVTDLEIQNATNLSRIKRPKESLIDAHELVLTRLFRYRYLPETVMRSGISVENYFISESGQHVTVILRVADGKVKKWYLIGTYRSKSEAILSGFKITKVLQDYTQSCERFAFIDHILLRPKEDTESNVPNDFFSLQCTVAFPLISERLRNKYFQELAEETFFLNVPSHIKINLLWLPYNDFKSLEEAFFRWRNALEQETKKVSEGLNWEEMKLEFARETLAEFLHEKLNPSDEPDPYISL